jgi:carbamoyl-phosphate synthase large subunit|tara:strand:- start:7451 stop:8356 length:906 start_codon:yes stop_codon:yes gene_type:complete
MQINCLFVGAGRRVALAKKFISHGFNIFAYEASSSVPIASTSKIILGRRWKDKDIVEHILDTIHKYNIKLLVPLQDEATYLLSKIKNQNVTDANILTSNIQSTAICFNKKFFSEFMENNFNYIYPSPDCFPQICKPMFGFSSKNISVIHNSTELSNVDQSTFVLQQQVSGKEYSVDCYFDKNSNFIDAVTRERIRVSGGEVITSKTDFIESIYKSSKSIGEKLKLIGPICMQYIIDKENNPFIIEINARFGGGSTLSMEAGLDMIALIKKEYFDYDYKYKPLTWKNNLLMERCYQDFFYET